MSKPVHISPNTEEPGYCRALIKCPFGFSKEEHFSSIKEAEEWLEEFRTSHFGMMSKPISKSPSDKYSILTDPKYNFQFIRSFNRIKGFSMPDGGLQELSESYREKENELRDAEFTDVTWKLISENTRRALNNYQGDKSRAINYFFNNQFDPSTADLDRNLYRSTIILDRFIKAHPTNKLEKLYRFEELYGGKREYDLVKNRLELLNPGDILNKGSYCSTSASLYNAFKFKGKKYNIVYQIYASDGAYINQSADEVLLDRDSDFMFHSFDEIDLMSNSFFSQSPESNEVFIEAHTENIKSQEDAIYEANFLKGFFKGGGKALLVNLVNYIDHKDQCLLARPNSHAKNLLSDPLRVYSLDGIYKTSRWAHNPPAHPLSQDERAAT